MTGTRSTAALALALATAACAGGGDPADDGVDVVAATPPAMTRIDAELVGGLRYLGNEVASSTLSPGGRGEIAHYWQAGAPLTDDPQIAAQIVSEAGDWFAIEPDAAAGERARRRWTAGQIVRQRQRFVLPATWRGSGATLLVSLQRRGASGPAARVPVVRGPVDERGRLVACRFAVERAAGGGAPTYAIRRARGPIALDGVADEADWRAAAMSPEFRDAEGGTPVGARTAARLLWDDAALYAFVEVEDADVASSYRERDDPLWKEDVVELFIDADGDRKGYVELQVNPRGAIFDAFFPATRAQPHHFEWNGGMRAAVRVDGTLDDRDDRDRGWTVELAIPHADVKGMAAAMPVRVPPAIGDRWRLNVVRVDKPRQGGIRAATWNPITIRDFHALSRMLTVVFADPDGATAAR